MAYNIVYLEDQQPDSIEHELKGNGFSVSHCKPDEFEKTLGDIKALNPDLILMDFRLHAGALDFNAPPFAQYFRSETTSGNKFIPIVLISTEEIIKQYHKDYTSFDLFDFAVSKEKFLDNISIYAQLCTDLIEGYQAIAEIQKSGEHLLELLKIPDDISYSIDSRLKDTLSIEQYNIDVYMASGFILNQIVKPVGLLIGDDVLSSRLGISSQSEDWEALVEHLKVYRYNGIFSNTYSRWWSAGFDAWWRTNISRTHPRRLEAAERKKLIEEKLGLNNLEPLEVVEGAFSSRFWTICSKTSNALDPSDGYELINDGINQPWLEPAYLSFNFLINADGKEINKLKEADRERFKENAQNG
ncbi:hypothetical protein [uncultured Amphritea sp.]|uniref:hypothetical protein n=1 Tax=uncultured Amphritea sp. TaxID=981605 RepID=UPI0025D04AAC|nr:hypothetical protein [uncultured Amphritea sp.]